MEQQDNISKWQRELFSFKGIKSTFMIEGNINDIYPVHNDDDSFFCNLNELLKEIFEDSGSASSYDLIFCDPLFRFSDPPNPNVRGAALELAKSYQELAKQESEDREKTSGGLSGSGVTQFSDIIRTAITRYGSSSNSEKPIAVIIDFASRFISSPDHLNSDETNIFLNLLYATKNAAIVNESVKTIVLIVDKYNDVPVWFYLNNPNVRTISIPNPDRATREAFLEDFISNVSEDEMFKKLIIEDVEMKALRKKLIDITEGMKLKELEEVLLLYKKSKIPVHEICDAISIYKFGFKENKWETMRDAMSEDIALDIQKRVKGQEQAVEKISRIIKRSVSGLSGMQHSTGGNKPRGIMFLAGPTGTGKTEIVKTVTEILFGDETALIRFDMSEYSAQNADQKLFGAPPGYVGYEGGGQLTNAVKANPFSVLLFDEIEKAHLSIMDKFLQILEDGRMTDGQGNTVYFSETLIFFTSNAGVMEEIIEHGIVIGSKPRISPETPYDEKQKIVEKALEEDTRFKPEVLNRIGKNIIVFNFISKEATEEILEKQITNIISSISHSKSIKILIEQAAMRLLLDKSLEDVVEYGGRGIGNVVENDFLNPLGEYIFDNNVQPENSVKITVSNGAIAFERT